MKSLALTLCVAGLVTTAQAQTDTGAQQKPMGEQALSVTGCVREAVDQPRLFVLVSDSTGAAAGHPVYRLEATQIDLKTHVGRVVRASGTLAKASQALSPEKRLGKIPASVTSAEVKDTPKLMVSAIQPVAEACPPASN